MKPLSDQDHYEILEIPRDVSSAAVERAYRLARSTFAEDSLALYSVVAPCDAEGIRERVEEAHRALSDPEARAEYDRHLSPPEVDAELAIRFDPEPARPAPGQRTHELDALEVAPEVYDGNAFHAARLRRGLDFEQVATLTKVNPRYLRFIEEENLEGLPARVYVRGFVDAFARTVGFDPAEAVRGYMERYDAALPAPKKPRPGFQPSVQIRERF